MNTQDKENASPKPGEEHTTADDISTDDSQKTEKLTKAGRDNFDPDEGSD